MKTEVYSWRVSPSLKAKLEEVARQERVSVAALLERIVRAWLDEHAANTPEGKAEQERLRAEAMRFAGILEGDDPHRAEKVSEKVREVLSRKYGR